MCKEDEKEQIGTYNKLCHPDCTKHDEICPRLEKSSDRPTKFSNLGFQFVYTLISWFLLFISTHDGNGYFVAQIMMCTPLVKWYLEYTPINSNRKKLRILSITLAFLNIIIVLLGLFGIFNVIYMDDLAYITLVSNNLTNTQFQFRLLYVWLFCGTMPSLTLIDFLANISPEEQIIDSSIDVGR